MEKAWRLIIDPKQNGYRNMAVDEALVQSYQKTKIPVLRIYGWESPFVTLGYNQKADSVLNNVRYDFTRRITGGAAILHHNELTYSLVCSKDDLDLNGNIKASYKKLCSFLIEFYLRLGFKADFACDLVMDGLGDYKEICFLSYEHYDILIQGKKIGGNAQKRGRDFIFQHGSIPQSIDLDLTRQVLKGSVLLEEKALWLDLILESKINFEILQEMLAASFSKVFQCKMIKSELSFEEQRDCRYLQENKYLNDEWKFKTSMVE